MWNTEWNSTKTFFLNILSQIRVACVYGNVGNEALMITKDDEVWAVGSNGAGCLGLGDMHSTLFPKKLEPLCSKVISYYKF